jgi:hypothetical protein
MQCLSRDRLVIPDVNKNGIIQGAGYPGQNDVTWGQDNCTSVPPDQKSKQSWITNLSLYRHCLDAQQTNIRGHIHKNSFTLWITNGPNKLACYIKLSKKERLARDKHLNLLGSLVREKLKCCEYGPLAFSNTVLWPVAVTSIFCFLDCINTT